LLAKTRRTRFQEVERRVTELHSYDVPEIIAVALEDIAAGYRAFLENSLGK
jgi:periplasmic divalent cation tolerance protein